jgi:AmmeMemoRadiSam system protein A
MKGASAPVPRNDEASGLDGPSRGALLRLARLAVRAALLDEVPPPVPALPELHSPRGAFVSLHTRGGELRGCVGLLRSDHPLGETVKRMAVAAATEDGRFSCLRADELPDLVIEISALGPLRPIRPEEVVVGLHGLLLRASGRSGVLLPQVAVAHAWDREQFLDRTAEKAGLPEGAWRQEGVEIFAFTAEVFGEGGE